jgi:ATP-dependent Clp endopeptidase proteolytic subunit ClpP
MNFVSRKRKGQRAKSKGQTARGQKPEASGKKEKRMNEILIYRGIGSGETQYNAEGFVATVGYLEHAQPGSELVLRFNSPGGSVFDGFAMISKLEETRLNTHAYIDGIAASMAAFIALRCDKITMSRNARLMLHLPQASASGDATRLRELAGELDEMKQRFAIIIAERAGITASEAEALYLQPGKDVWLTAQQALEANLVDELTGIEQLVPMRANAAEMFEIYAQLIDNQKQKQMNKEKLLGLFGAQANAEMTEDEVFAMVEAMFTEHQALKAETEGLKAEVLKWENEKAAAKVAEVTALLNAAVEDKRITAEQKPMWENMFVKDHDNAKALLGTMKPPQTIKEFIKAPVESTEAELVAEYHKADRAGKLAGIKENEPEKFKAMFKAVFKTEYQKE